MKVTAGGKVTMVRAGQAASVGGGEGGGKKRRVGAELVNRKRGVISPVRIQRNLGEQKNPEEITQDRATGESPRRLLRHLRPIRDLGKAVREEESRPRRRQFRFLMWMFKRSLPRLR